MSPLLARNSCGAQLAQEAALESELERGLVPGHGCEVWIIQQESHYGGIAGIFFPLSSFLASSNSEYRGRSSDSMLQEGKKPFLFVIFPCE